MPTEAASATERSTRRKEYLRTYQREWWRTRRAAFFATKQCDDCGSSSRLELHHRDPQSKISHSIWSWSQLRRESEAAKCVVLCHDCHKQITRLDFAARHALALKPSGTCVYWYAPRRKWQVQFAVMGKKMRIGGGGFRNPVTAQVAADSFRRTLAAHYAKLGVQSRVACVKQLPLPLSPAFTPLAEVTQ